MVSALGQPGKFDFIFRVAIIFYITGLKNQRRLGHFQFVDRFGEQNIGKLFSCIFDCIAGNVSLTAGGRSPCVGRRTGVRNKKTDLFGSDSQSLGGNLSQNRCRTLTDFGTTGIKSNVAP